MQSDDDFCEKMDGAYPNKNMKRERIGLGRSQLWGINTFTKPPHKSAIIAALSLTKQGNINTYASFL